MLRGGFHQVEFRNGDFIEFAVGFDTGYAAAHAARSPRLRILWMPPHRVRGHAIQKICDIRWSFFFPTLAIVLIGISEFLMGRNFGEDGLAADAWFYSMCFVLTLIITVWIRSRFRAFAVETTEVMRVLGYDHPEQVDLWVRHKAAQKAMAASTNTLPPLLEPWSYRY
ncbi:hypothetical protein [Rugamonas rivuli]|uniref:Uncharacterized protein n=1 Tax=Rugamonas rivuli TaxID=2743358 RepID=A0A843SE35_9BURK|nr:hypothetical protein [Rugamonas rivuli]MQA22815.1 hypothetical protein [Rugamonas rivuli]